MIYFTSDWRLGDGAASARRGFSSHADMKAQYLANWKANVDADDTVFMLGDFSIEKPKLIRETLRDMPYESLRLQTRFAEYRKGPGDLPREADGVVNGEPKFIYNLLNVVPSIIGFNGWLGAHKKSPYFFASNNPNDRIIRDDELRDAVVLSACRNDAKLAATIRHAIIFGGIPAIERDFRGYGRNPRKDPKKPATAFFNVSMDASWTHGRVRPATTLIELTDSMVGKSGL